MLTRSGKQSGRGAGERERGREGGMEVSKLRA